MTTGAFLFEWENPSQGEQPTSDSDNDTKSIFNHPRQWQHLLTSRETEFFIPSQLTHSRKVVVEGSEDGDKYRYDERQQTLIFVTLGHGHHSKNRTTDNLVTLSKPELVITSKHSISQSSETNPSEKTGPDQKCLDALCKEYTFSTELVDAIGERNRGQGSCQMGYRGDHKGLSII